METLVREHIPARPSAPHAPEQAKSALWVPYLAEVLGTFGLVFAGCGAIVIDSVSGGQITHVGVGLVFGLVITVMIYTLTPLLMGTNCRRSPKAGKKRECSNEHAQKERDNDTIAHHRWQ